MPNPGPGGFAVILGREAKSSNIRMEGLAIIAAIRGAKGRQVEIHTDSEFWINVITKWMSKWAENGWKKKRGEIKNLDIVKQLYELYDPEQVKLVWVQGHVGTELNELADEWANKAREGYNLGA